MSFKLPKSFTRVTPFSKALALSMLIVFPIVGFLIGINYQKNKTENITQLDNLQAVQQTSMWKSYSDNGFSIFIPSQWNVNKSYSGGEDSLLSGIMFNGSEGYVSIEWANSYIGTKTCSNIINIQSRAGEIKLCKIIGKELTFVSNETTGYLYSGGKVYWFQAGIKSSSPDNLELIINILSTFKFTN